MIVVPVMVEEETKALGGGYMEPSEAPQIGVEAENWNQGALLWVALSKHAGAAQLGPFPRPP